MLKHYASKINFSYFYLPSSAKEKDNFYPENIERDRFGGAIFQKQKLPRYLSKYSVKILLPQTENL